VAHLLPQISPVFSSLPSHEKAGPIVADPLGRAAPRRSDCLPKASVCEGFEGDPATAIKLFPLGVGKIMWDFWVAPAILIATS